MNEERDLSIYRMRNQGMSCPQLSDLFHMSYSRIYEIIRGIKADFAAVDELIENNEYRSKAAMLGREWNGEK